MTDNEQRGKCYPLRMPQTMRADVETAANGEGISINQFIAMAVAEKIIQREMHPPRPEKTIDTTHLDKEP